MPIAKTCEVCGAGFFVPPARAQTALTCSRACKGKQTAARYASKRIEQVCARCGETFNYPVNEEGRRKHCSYACANLAKVGMYHGPLIEDGRLQDHTYGYIWEICRNHPHAVDRAVTQHRLVMERAMREEVPDHQFLETINGARYLRCDIHVHHINEEKRDNRLSNLIACTSACHRDLHAGRIPMRGELWPEPEITRDREHRMVWRYCKQCGAEFSKKLSDVKRGSGLYCSRLCYDVSRAVSNVPLLVGRKCLVCEKPFLAKRHKVVEGVAKFCSNACRHASRIGHRPTHVHQYQ